MASYREYLICQPYFTDWQLNPFSIYNMKTGKHKKFKVQTMDFRLDGYKLYYVNWLSGPTSLYDNPGLYEGIRYDIRTGDRDVMFGGIEMSDGFFTDTDLYYTKLFWNPDPGESSYYHYSIGTGQTNQISESEYYLKRDEIK